jgi:tripeptidyl-peptidase-1
VTVVGGTQFSTTSVMGDETTWASGGGGFSDTFDQPTWQGDVVSAYLSSDVTMPDSSFFTATGRAYPDVSALAGTANGYCVAYDGTFGKVGGTSAATPVFSALVAQLNDKLLSAGQPALGFLNPWIYQTAAQSVADGTPAFFDVTTGQNNDNQGQGFEATVGWDPASGVGTPNFSVLGNYIGL